MTPNSFTILLLFILIVINTGALVCMGLLISYLRKWIGGEENEER